MICSGFFAAFYFKTRERKMVLTIEAKQKAYLEAERILALGKKWQQLVPGEKRPNFERAAAEVIRRALGHKTSSARHNLEISNRLMHQHGPNEARLIERTLRSGSIHPDVLHSFRDNRRTRKPRPVKFDLGPLPDHLPEPELWIAHGPGDDIEHASHFNVNTGQFHSHVVDLHAGGAKEIKMGNVVVPLTQTTGVEV